MTEMAEEEWRPIPGYENAYEVSSHGRVRSCSRVIHFSDGRVRPYQSRLMNLGMTRYGYPRVSLRNKWHQVHRLVLEAFVGPCPDGMECRHLDDVKTNNHLTNLAWGTRRENRADMVRNGKSRNQNSDKTHCVNGHAFDEPNTWTNGRRRVCLACGRDRKRKQYAGKRWCS